MLANGFLLITIFWSREGPSMHCLCKLEIEFADRSKISNLFKGIKTLSSSKYLKYWNLKYLGVINYKDLRKTTHEIGIGFHLPEEILTYFDTEH